MGNPNTKYETGVWYGWNGRKCPVHPETVVEVAWSVSAPTAHHRPHKAGQWNWSTGQIVSFRIVTPYVEPAPKLECWVVVEDGYFYVHATEEKANKFVEDWNGGTIHRMVEADE